jgi:hypothetical protein
VKEQRLVIGMDLVPHQVSGGRARGTAGADILGVATTD